VVHGSLELRKGLPEGRVTQVVYRLNTFTIKNRK